MSASNGLSSPYEPSDGVDAQSRLADNQGHVGFGEVNAEEDAARIFGTLKAHLLGIEHDAAQKSAWIRLVIHTIGAYLNRTTLRAVRSR
jgi:hypothetical protein